MSLVAALALIAAVQAAPAVVLPGVLDLPLAEGSTPMADCGWLQETVSKAASVQCVSTSMAMVDEVIRAYAKSAKTHGWSGGGGEANVSRLYRRNLDGACEEMGLAAFPAGPNSGPADLAILIIGSGPSNRCPTPSDTQ